MQMCKSKGCLPGKSIIFCKFTVKYTADNGGYRINKCDVDIFLYNFLPLFICKNLSKTVHASAQAFGIVFPVFQ